MHINIRITKSDCEIPDICVFHFGSSERTNLSSGRLCPFSYDFTKTNILHMQNIGKEYLLLT